MGSMPFMYVAVPSPTIMIPILSRFSHPLTSSPQGNAGLEENHKKSCNSHNKRKAKTALNN